jgi:hypothetical protein
MTQIPLSGQRLMSAPPEPLKELPKMLRTEITVAIEDFAQGTRTVANFLVSSVVRVSLEQSLLLQTAADDALAHLCCEPSEFALSQVSLRS